MYITVVLVGWLKSLLPSRHKRAASVQFYFKWDVSPKRIDRGFHLFCNRDWNRRYVQLWHFDFITFMSLSNAIYYMTTFYCISPKVRIFLLRKAGSERVINWGIVFRRHFSIRPQGTDLNESPVELRLCGTTHLQIFWHRCRSVFPVLGSFWIYYSCQEIVYFFEYKRALPTSLSHYKVHFCADTCKKYLLNMHPRCW